MNRVFMKPTKATFAAPKVIPARPSARANYGRAGLCNATNRGHVAVNDAWRALSEALCTDPLLKALAPREINLPRQRHRQYGLCRKRRMPVAVWSVIIERVGVCPAGKAP